MPRQKQRQLEDRRRDSVEGGRHHAQRRIVVIACRAASATWKRAIRSLLLRGQVSKHQDVTFVRADDSVMGNRGIEGDELPTLPNGERE